MTDWDIEIGKFGDPLLDPSAKKSECCCLIDREHRSIILAIADPRFPSLQEETKMLWLRKFGVISDITGESFKFPSSVEKLSPTITPPDMFSPSKLIAITFDGRNSRESIAWFSRAIWQLLEVDEIPEETRSLFALNWVNHAGEQCSSSLKQFLSRPKIISVSDKAGTEEPAADSGEKNASGPTDQNSVA
ncbi:MAG: hypothetical protein ABIG96_00120 [Candidatus Micrarchaeota archaeon]